MIKERTLLTLADYSVSDIEYILQQSYSYKYDKTASVPQIAKNALMVLYFEKKSTRTRLSCTRAWTKMGGTVIDLSPQDGKSHINTNETLYDSFRVISDMADCIVARVNSHETLHTIRKAALDSGKQPIVLNGLSDLYHPLQILADMLTLYEDVNINKNTTNVRIHNRSSFSEVLTNLNVSWIGDSNNVVNSLLLTLPRFGVNMKICTPKQYPIKRFVLDQIHKDDFFSRLSFYDNPINALSDADYIITDTWVSMGDEHDKVERISHFNGFQINDILIKQSNVKDNWKFLHCLPRKKEEVSDEIFYSNRSLVFTEAENRMWTTMAVFHILLSR